MVEMKETNGAASSQMLTLSEVASLINVHANSVRRWSDLGLLKCYRIGIRGDRRFKPDEVREFIENGKSRDKGCRPSF